jgi:hypothetical protein
MNGEAGARELGVAACACCTMTCPTCDAFERAAVGCPRMGTPTQQVLTYIFGAEAVGIYFRDVLYDSFLMSVEQAIIHFLT